VYVFFVPGIPNDERRKDPRFHFGHIVEVTFARIQGQVTAATLLCKTADISSRGVRVMSSHDVQVGSSVSLKIYADPKHPFIRRGAIRWVKKEKVRPVYEIGIEFTDTSLHKSSGWKEFIEGLGLGLTDPGL
jgi:hypothetical protein